MRQIRHKDTKPELLVRQLVHGLGYRYRLYAKELPGKPDLVFRPRKKVIFVHGCFWHSHDIDGCTDSRRPKSNTGYWIPKLIRNKERDQNHIEVLKGLGYEVLVIWDCETKDPGRLTRRIQKFLGR